KWSEVITHVPCGGSGGRLGINATLVEIDGDGGADGLNRLGYAGPITVCDDYLTISHTGEMTFDVYDIANLEADGTLEGVILHEMGHVICVG
ncbi:unnamed protein product, partial [Laminaria digitata]